MKAQFTKVLFSIISVLCFILDSQMSFAQWTFNTMGNNFTTPANPNSIANTNGTGTVNYTHRSFMINPNHVKAYHQNEEFLMMTNGQKAEVSRRKKSVLRHL